MVAEPSLTRTVNPENRQNGYDSLSTKQKEVFAAMCRFMLSRAEEMLYEEVLQGAATILGCELHEIVALNPTQWINRTLILTMIKDRHSKDIVRMPARGTLLAARQDEREQWHRMEIESHAQRIPEYVWCHGRKKKSPFPLPLAHKTMGTIRFEDIDDEDKRMLMRLSDEYILLNGPTNRQQQGRLYMEELWDADEVIGDKVHRDHDHCKKMWEDRFALFPQLMRERLRLQREEKERTLYVPTIYKNFKDGSVKEIVYGDEPMREEVFEDRYLEEKDGNKSEESLDRSISSESTDPNPLFENPEFNPVPEESLFPVVPLSPRIPWHFAGFQYVPERPENEPPTSSPSLQDAFVPRSPQRTNRTQSWHSVFSEIRASLPPPVVPQQETVSQTFSRLSVQEKAQEGRPSPSANLQPSENDRTHSESTSAVPSNPPRLSRVELAVLREQRPGPSLRVQPPRRSQNNEQTTVAPQTEGGIASLPYSAHPLHEKEEIVRRAREIMQGASRAPLPRSAEILGGVRRIANELPVELPVGRPPPQHQPTASSTTATCEEIVTEPSQERRSRSAFGGVPRRLVRETIATSSVASQESRAQSISLSRAEPSAAPAQPSTTRIRHNEVDSRLLRPRPLQEPIRPVVAVITDSSTVATAPTASRPEVFPTEPPARNRRSFTSTGRVSFELHPNAPTSPLPIASVAPVPRQPRQSTNSSAAAAAPVPSPLTNEGPPQVTTAAPPGASHLAEPRLLPPFVFPRPTIMSYPAFGQAGARPSFGGFSHQSFLPTSSSQFTNERLHSITASNDRLQEDAERPTTTTTAVLVPHEEPRERSSATQQDHSRMPSESVTRRQERDPQPSFTSSRRLTEVTRSSIPVETRANPTSTVHQTTTNEPPRSLTQRLWMDEAVISRLQRVQPAVLPSRSRSVSRAATESSQRAAASTATGSSQQRPIVSNHAPPPPSVRREQETMVSRRSGEVRTREGTCSLAHQQWNSISRPEPPTGRDFTDHNLIIHTIEFLATRYPLFLNALKAIWEAVFMMPFDNMVATSLSTLRNTGLFVEYQMEGEPRHIQISDLKHCASVFHRVQPIHDALSREILCDLVHEALQNIPHREMSLNMLNYECSQEKFEQLATFYPRKFRLVRPGILGLIQIHPQQHPPS